MRRPDDPSPPSDRDERGARPELTRGLLGIAFVAAATLGLVAVALLVAVLVTALV